MVRRLKFTKEKMDWFAVIPEWEGSRADLQMVAGADTFLEVLCQGEWDVWLTLSDEPFPNNEYEVLTLLREDDDIGGGHYILENYKGIEFNIEMWLCDVTKFVFGRMPKKIYFIG
jgi:hypothetical protein